MSHTLEPTVYIYFFRLPYASIFGGAGSFKKEHFEKINGFSNKFWGWGGEDDDLYKRYAAIEFSWPSMPCLLVAMPSKDAVSVYLGFPKCVLLEMATVHSERFKLD